MTGGGNSGVVVSCCEVTELTSSVENKPVTVVVATTCASTIVLSTRLMDVVPTVVAGAMVALVSTLVDALVACRSRPVVVRSG